MRTKKPLLRLGGEAGSWANKSAPMNAYPAPALSALVTNPTIWRVG